MNAYYQVRNDIDLDDWNTVNGTWTPIGSISNRFIGSLDGDGHIVSNLTIAIANSSSNYNGFFGVIGTGGVVKDLTFSDVDIAATAATDTNLNLGSIAGASLGSIENCSVTGEVTATSPVHTTGQVRFTCAGGLVGFNQGAIVGCTSSADVTAVSANDYNSPDYVMAGGIVGNATLSGSRVANCYATGNILAEGNGSAEAGGIVGRNEKSAVIENCAVSVSVTAKTRKFHAYGGGIVGSLNSAVVKNCYASGEASATCGTGSNAWSFASGIAGENYAVNGNGDSSVEYCYAAVTVTADGPGKNAAGGIAGVNQKSYQSSGIYTYFSNITNCAVVGGPVSAVSGAENYARRVVGSDSGNYWGPGTHTNNYASSGMALTGAALAGDTDDLNGIGGMGVTAADYGNESWWNGSGTGFWYSVWGSNAAAPWQWGGTGYPLPVLYWQ